MKIERFIEQYATIDQVTALIDAVSKTKTLELELQVAHFLKWLVHPPIMMGTKDVSHLTGLMPGAIFPQESNQNDK